MSNSPFISVKQQNFNEIIQLTDGCSALFPPEDLSPPEGADPLPAPPAEATEELDEAPPTADPPDEAEVPAMAPSRVTLDPPVPDPPPPPLPAPVLDVGVVRVKFKVPAVLLVEQKAPHSNRSTK